MGSLTSKTATSCVEGKDLSGRVAIVTGPTTGIGYEISQTLASVGCHVILAGRKQSRLEKIAQDMTQYILKKTPHAKVQFTPIELDLMSLASVHAFATRFIELGIPCHYLFNNAGVANPRYGHTVDGFEITMATNCIGHQLLTNLLLPTLIASSTPTTPSRVINTSSMGHAYSTYNVKGGEQELKSKLYPTEKEYGGMSWYAHSKLGNVWHAREITRRYGQQGVVAIAVHPGAVSTDIAQQNWLAETAWYIMAWALKTANQGAAPEVWAAVDPDWPTRALNDPQFSFYGQDCHITSASRKSQHTEFAKLWYDYNDSEIARILTQLVVPVSLPSSVPASTSSTSTSTVSSTTS